MNFDHPLKIGNSAFLWKHGLREHTLQLIDIINRTSRISPFRKMLTPHGYMSVEMTSAGLCGWISEAKGYSYSDTDPLTSKSWPPLDASIMGFAADFASHSGFPGFDPSVCLINRYTLGTRLGMHVDKDERDVFHPIVAISLGIPAVFRWGGLSRSDKTIDIHLENGDVIVWGGEDRLRYHGITKVIRKENEFNLDVRYTMTFRHVPSAVIQHYQPAM